MKKLAIRIVLLTHILSACLLSHTATANEDQRLFKAAFIYNFAKFTRWPTSPEENIKTEITLCTLGEDQLVYDLNRLKGKIIKNKTLSVQLYKKSNECDMLYIASSKKNNYKKTLKAISNKPILTISEIRYFALSGGIIELNLDKGYTRITANLNAANKSNLELSSRLLILANIIDDNSKK